ncbi:MAG: hypothetical protein OEY18_04885 [Candidatus Aminicenantes bacterium]|nr:hypothetical protein [Candidatus Aminicenantes bacterium]MDH5384024.1 hypothetical protein [Candidatus Aminicenantes bacterium]MDH5744858.1 hypothetical protein [Candidatus Aminicenantes bacterium]
MDRNISYSGCLKIGFRVLAVEAPRFRKGSGAKEDSSPASSLIIL